MSQTRADKLAEARTWAGYRDATVARTTGTLVVLVEAEPQGISSPTADGGDGRWALVCADHAGCVCDDLQANLRTFMAHPEEWCPDCSAGGAA